MINNRIKQAKFKLSQHKVQGVQSTLSIFEVANLMDTLRKGEDAHPQGSSLFFSMN